jgi:hypothetical protein
MQLVSKWSVDDVSSQKLEQEWLKRIHIHDGDNGGSGTSSGSEVP